MMLSSSIVRCLGLASVSVGVIAAQDWLDAPRVVLPDGPEGIRKVADLDGDGDADLLVVEADGGVRSFHALLQEPGGFQAGPTTVLPVLADVTNGNEILELGDLTGDGLPDLVIDVSDTSVPGQAHHALRFFSNTGGAFAEQISATMEEFPWEGALANADGSGGLELAVLGPVYTPGVGFEHRVRWWRWNGTTLAPRAPAVLLETPGGLAAADFTGDGRSEILVAASSGRRVGLYTTLLGGQPALTSTLLLGGNGSARRLQPGDVDGDGDVDLLVTWSDGSGPRLLVATNGGGALVSGPTQNLPPGTSSPTGLLADWDLDSDLDFLLYGPRLTLLENREGTFVLADSMRTTGFSSGGVGDWSGDGLPDFAAGGFVYAGDGELGEVPWTSTLSNLACLDHDADGDLEVFDFYLSSVPFINEGGPDVFENDGSGKLTSRTVSVPVPPAGHLYRGDHPPVDLDGDGFGDLLRTLVLNQYPDFPVVETRLFRGTASGAFTYGGTAGPAGGGPVVFRNMTADLDGDGDPDVLANGGYNENDGSGFFPSFHPSWSGSPLETADLDGDGDLDELVGLETTIAIARNQGGAFTNEVITSQAVAEASHLGDLDDDGDLDLVLGTTAGGPAVLLYENVAGSFAPPRRLDQEHDSVHSFAIEDFDGDGQKDVLAMPDTRMNDTIVWYLWRQTSAWEFAPPAQYLGGTMGISGDLDGDGDRDFFADRLVRSRRFAGPSDGRIRQVGAGLRGGEPVAPLLGASGPLRPGSTSAVLHVSRARGGALGQLFLSGRAFAGSPGLLRRVGSLTPILTFALDGSAGASGEGNFEMSLGPSTLALQGQKVWMHAVIADPSLPRSLASTTNVLELTFGH